MIQLPTTEQLMCIHQWIARDSGGSSGVRDRGLIDSALARAQAGFGGVEPYPTLAEKAAAVAHGLICNHGFVDGNKRIGVIALLLILRMNGSAFAPSQQAVIQLGLEAARGRMTVEAIVDWIGAHGGA